MEEGMGQMLLPVNSFLLVKFFYGYSCIQQHMYICLMVRDIDALHKGALGACAS